MRARLAYIAPGLSGPGLRELRVDGVLRNAHTPIEVDFYRALLPHAPKANTFSGTSVTRKEARDKDRQRQNPHRSRPAGAVRRVRLRLGVPDRRVRVARAMGCSPRGGGGGCNPGAICPPPGGARRSL